jgi:PAS domain S-box-containing protein
MFLQKSSTPTRASVGARYGTIAGSVALALALSLLLRPIVEPNPFIFFFAAVAISAWYGGLWAGILATVVSLLLANYFLIAPLYTLSRTPSDILRGAVFLFVAGLISWLAEARRLAEARARAQGERYQVTLASIGDAVIATDERGCVTFMNSVAEQLTGWTVAEAYGRAIAEVFRIVSATTRQPAEIPVERVLREGRVVGPGNDTLLIARAGAEWPIDDSGAPIKGEDGAIIGTVLVFRDMTERARAQAELAELLAREQAARDAAEAAVLLRDQFLSIAAHELKTPLTSLMGYAQLFLRRVTRDGHLSDRDQRALQQINEQIGRLNRMVLAMLDVSRLETGQLSIERAPLNLATLVGQVVEDARATLDGRTIDVRVADEPLTVNGDELRIEQALQNLIQNALKYSGPSEAVTVELGHRDGVIEVAVRDRGIGIPKDELAKLFSRFYRASNATEQNISGMGIGLYVVREIVHLHGGEVLVESEEGAGSTFTIRLPAL